ncbi:MAG: glycosyltransferase family 39 protein [Ardenticatenaceae bacterium]|nr:glycosyltransferase family 39 protein [Ardenticatenaceae bacterium]
MSRLNTWKLLLLVLVLFVGWQSANLDAFEPDYDEGVYLSEARLLHEGYTLYTEIKSPSPPLFIWGLATSFAVAGRAAVEPARVLIVLSGAMGLAALVAIGRRLAPAVGGFAGLLAVTLLVLFPRWSLYGRLAMSDIPSLSFTMLAVALALQSWPDGQRRWLGLAGAAAALALLTKMLATYAVPLLALIVLLGRWRDRERLSWTAWLQILLLDGLVTLIGFLVPVLLILPWLDVPAAYELLFRFHWEAGRAWTDPPNALRLMAIFLGEHAGWTLLALVGWAWLVRRRAWRSLALLIGWAALVVAMLSQHAPLWGHLLLPLVPPLTLAGGIALAESAAALLAARRAQAAARDRLVLITAAALLVAVPAWPVALHRDEALFSPVSRPTLLRTSVIPWLMATVPPDQPLVSDDPMIAFRAGRRLPPDLTDTSFTKIASGFLTVDELVAATQREQPAAIVFWSDRFASLPEWRAWVEKHYVVGCQYAPKRVLFLRPDLADRAPLCP